MSQTRFRQVARLEKLTPAYLQRRRQTEKEWQRTRLGAAAHAATLAFLIRYGKPTIDEPLACAWQRCSDSSAWKEYLERFESSAWKEHLERFNSSAWKYGEKFRRIRFAFEPNSRDRVELYGMRLRHVIIASFPGADEKNKFGAVFASAPPWLIWFTFADYTAELLGLTLPDLSRVVRFARSKANFDLWYGLPSGAFERRPWPDGPDNEPLARTDLKLLRPDLECPDNQMTPRERTRARATYMKSHPMKRTDHWPVLIPAEILEMPKKDRMALAELKRGTPGPYWRSGG